jgi:hypothetical protein
LSEGAEIAPDRGEGQEETAALLRPYSLAFERFVENEHDIEGLLAYALYKATVREDALRGFKSGNARDPSPAMVKTFKEAAVARLIEFADGMIEDATPELQQSAALDAVSGLHQTLTSQMATAVSTLKSHVDDRTGLRPSIFANVVAWVFTLAITALVLIANGRVLIGVPKDRSAASSAAPASSQSPSQSGQSGGQR